MTGRRKLTEKQAKEIRELRKSGAKEDQLIDIYDISQGSIQQIVHGKTYKDAGGPIVGEDYNIDHGRKMTATKAYWARVIKKELDITYQQIADILGGGSKQSIRQIIVGKTFKKAGGPIKGVDYDV